MKRIYVLFVLATLGLGATGCSSDDNASGDDKKALLQGEWVQTTHVYLDKERKELGSKPTSENDGCGRDQVVFTSETWVSNFYFKDGEVCDSEEVSGTYSLKGNLLLTTPTGYEEDVAEIVELTKNKLGVIDISNPHSEEEVNEENFPKGTVYTKIVFTRK